MIPLLILSSSLSLAAKEGSLKDLDKHAGFRELPFGTKCDEVEGFKGNKLALKVAGAGRSEKQPYMGMVQYRNPDDQLVIGSTDLLDVAYTCYRDQLMGVQVLAWGPRAAEDLLYTFTTAFGGPPTADPDLGVWRWTGKKVSLELAHDRPTDAVTAVFTSLPSVERKRADDVALRRSAVEDL